MEHAGAVTAFLIQIEQPRERAAVLSSVQRQLPVALGVVGQARVAQLRTALESKAQHQVHALPGAKTMQGLGQGLHSLAQVLCSAVGRGDQDGGDLRVRAHLFFQQPQVEAIGIQAALDRQLHIGQQGRAVCQLTPTLQEGRQGHTWGQRRHIAGDRLPGAQQQALQAKRQALHVQRLGQVRRGRQRDRLAHAGTVVAVTHQNKRQRRMTAALAHTAQQTQAIDSRQLAIGNYQVVGLLGQQLQGLLAVGTQVQPCVAAHVQ
ncbi:hypothetical protein D3C81_1263430 [compost metagenome]